MPRRARAISLTGIYHVMMRGINHQQIFYDERDYYKYLEILQQYSELAGYKVFAFSLMGNHIHLLIQEGKEQLGLSFKRIGASFGYWYNAKYERCGHIFQGRYKSEPVETIEYFYTVFRYILRNPVMAGLCASPENYKYSNARHLINDLPTFTSKNMVYKYISRDKMKDFLMEEDDKECLDIEKSPRKRVPDELAAEMIRVKFGTINPAPGKKGSAERRDFCEAISFLLSKGLAKRQLSRLTGLPRCFF